MLHVRVKVVVGMIKFMHYSVSVTFSYKGLGEEEGSQDLAHLFALPRSMTLRFQGTALILTPYFVHKEL